MRTENMQAYANDLARCFEIHGRGKNCEDGRREIMIKAVEQPGYFNCTDADSIYFWKQFAKEQIEYGRDAVAEIKAKTPELYAEVDKEDLSIGYICRVIEGGWEYGELFMCLLQGLKTEA